MNPRNIVGWAPLRNFTAIGTSQIIGRGIRFLYFVIIVKFLTPSEVGVYSYGIAFYLTLLGLGAFGQNVLLSTRIGKRRANYKVIVQHSLTITVGMLGVAGVFGFVILRLAGPSYDSGWALDWLVLALIARGLSEWVRLCFFGLENAGWVPRYELLFRSAEAASGTLILFVGGGLVGICFIHFLYWALEAASSFRLFLHRTDIPLRFGGNLRLLKLIVRVSAVYVVSFGFMQAFAQIGVVGLTLMGAGAEMVAQFAIAMQLFTTLLILPTALGQAILPAVSRAFRLGVKTDMQMIAFAVKLCVVVGIGIAILAKLAAPWFVELIFGQQYALAGASFASLTWAVGPYAGAVILVQALNALNCRYLAAGMAILMVTVHLFVMLMVMPAGAVEAGVISLSVAAIIGMIFGAIQISSKIGIKGCSWWLYPLALLVVTGALFQTDLVNNLFGIIVVSGIVVLLTWQLRVFSRTEVYTLLGKLKLAPQ